MIGIAGNTDAEVGFLAAVDSETLALLIAAFVEGNDLLNELVSVRHTALARTPVRDSLRRIAAKRENVANAEKMMIDELVLDFLRQKVAAGEVRDARKI